MVSKREFIKYFQFLKEMRERENVFVDALEKLSPGNYCNCFLYDEYEENLVNLLETMFQDENEDISYFLYEVGWIWGDVNIKRCPKYKNNKYVYKSVETLYDYLVKKVKK